MYLRLMITSIEPASFNRCNADVISERLAALLLRVRDEKAGHTPDMSGGLSPV